MFKRTKLRSEWGAEEEERLSFEEFYARRGVRLGGAVSKPSRSKSRIDPLVDRAILQSLRGKLKNSRYFAVSDKRPCLVGKRGSKRSQQRFVRRKKRGFKALISKITKNRFDRIKLPITGKLVPRVYLPSWDHISEIMKCAFYGAAMDLNRRFAFTLRLAPNIVDEALRSPKGFAGYMQNRIGRELRQEFAVKEIPDFVFAVEGFYIGGLAIHEFHLHGAIELPASKGAGFAERHAVKKALRKAGGLPGRSAARQLDFRRMHEPFGWFAYVAKYRFCTLASVASARRAIRTAVPSGDKGVVGATTSIRQRAKEYFHRARSTETLIHNYDPRKRRVMRRIARLV